jgi:hypothetical protein
MCALDIDNLGYRGSSMALERMCGQFIHIQPYTLSYMRTRTHAHIGGAAAHNDRACVDDRPSAVRRGARRAGSGAYEGQRRDGGSVPRADVRVEGRRRLERLRAENTTLGGGGKCSHASARMRARPRTHTRARAHARLGACAAHVRHGDTRVRRSAYRAGCVHVLYTNTDPSVRASPRL